MEKEILNTISNILQDLFILAGGWGLGLVFLGRFVLDKCKEETAGGWAIVSWTILWTGVFFKYLG